MPAQTEDLRVAAADALASMGTTAATAEIVSVLVRLLRDESRSVRYASGRALSSMALAVATDDVIRELLEQVIDGLLPNIAR
jgi:HEAT repeat protein